MSRLHPFIVLGFLLCAGEARCEESNVGSSASFSGYQRVQSQEKSLRSLKLLKEYFGSDEWRTLSKVIPQPWAQFATRSKIEAIFEPEDHGINYSITLKMPKTTEIYYHDWLSEVIDSTFDDAIQGKDFVVLKLQLHQRIMMGPKKRVQSTAHENTGFLVPEVRLWERCPEGETPSRWPWKR